jgi:hypothetical protein
MKIEISRRKLLASAPAVAAVGMPAVASALSGFPGDPDAELLALGAELDAFYPEYLTSGTAANAASETAWIEAERSLGFKREDDVTPELLETMFGVREKSGAEAIIDKDQAITGHVDEIHRKIIELPAHTLAGIAVKARAGAMLMLSDLWSEPAIDMDYDKFVMRRLIESILESAGIELPFEVDEDENNDEA